MMRLSKLLLWTLVFFLTIFEAISFILALTNREKSLAACEQANPTTKGATPTGGSGANNTTLTVGDYSATFLGMQVGNTYGLANCPQAVQADVIGSAIILFVGQLFMVRKVIWFGWLKCIHIFFIYIVLRRTYCWIICI